MERATLGCGGDGGSGGDGGGRAGSDCGVCGERATLGSGSDGVVELGAIVVDVDEFWAQEETVGEFVSCGCS